MILKEILDKTAKFFREKNIPSPRLDAEILLSRTLGMKNRLDLYMKFDRPMSEQDLVACREVVKRRVAGEPVAYIIGEKDFYKHSFKVGRGVLIPRPETELIVEKALAWATENSKPELSILDLGAGTGCIGLSIVAQLADANLSAVEKSPEALAFAVQNCADLGLSQKSQILLGDAKEVLMQGPLKLNKFDVVVANPPYISQDDPEVEESVKLFEPAAALFAEKNGLALIEEWVNALHGHLNDSTIVMFEIGRDQGAEAHAIFLKTGLFKQVLVQKDLSGLDRFVIGLKD